MVAGGARTSGRAVPLAAVPVPIRSSRVVPLEALTDVIASPVIVPETSTRVKSAGERLLTFCSEERRGSKEDGSASWRPGGSRRTPVSGGGGTTGARTCPRGRPGGRG